MSILLPSTARLSPPARRDRIVTPGSVAGTAVVTLLIGSQLAIVTAAFVYSLIVLLHMATTLAAVLGGLLAAVSLWGIVIVARLAFEAETDPANN